MVKLRKVIQLRKLHGRCLGVSFLYRTRKRLWWLQRDPLGLKQVIVLRLQSMTLKSSSKTALMTIEEGCTLSLSIQSQAGLKQQKYLIHMTRLQDSKSTLLMIYQRDISSPLPVKTIAPNSSVTILRNGSRVWGHRKSGTLPTDNLLPSLDWLAESWLLRVEEKLKKIVFLLPKFLELLSLRIAKKWI